MIDLHYWPTPNGWKASIMLEECGLAYQTTFVNIGKGDQFEPAFLKINPNAAEAHAAKAAWALHWASMW